MKAVYAGSRFGPACRPKVRQNSTTLGPVRLTASSETRLAKVPPNFLGDGEDTDNFLTS